MSGDQSGLVSVRSAVIFLVAFLCGAVVGTLTFWAYGIVPGAVLAGVCVMAVAIPVLHHQVIRR